MLDKILLNWEPYNMAESNLPALITYDKHMGGSHLSIVLIADLFLRGSKIIFLTAYPMAHDNFLNQVNGKNSNIAYVDSLDGLSKSTNAQAIIIESGNAVLFLNVIKKLPDLNDRIIFIKNIEIFNEEVYDACIGFKKLILSGNIDECNFNKKISNHQFKTIIAFNQPDTPLNIKVPLLEKWSSYLWTENENGILSIEK